MPEPIQCAQWEARASDWLEGQVTPETAALLQAHARQCPACGELLEQLRQLRTAFAAWPEAPLPEGFMPQVLARTSGLRDQAGWRAAFASLKTLLWQPRWAMALAAVWFGFILIVNAAGIRLNHLRWAGVAENLLPSRLAALVTRQAHRTYARGIRYYSDLHMVYEIQVALHAMRNAPPAARRPAHGGQVYPPVRPRRPMLLGANGRTAHNAAMRCLSLRPRFTQRYI